MKTSRIFWTLLLCLGIGFFFSGQVVAEEVVSEETEPQASTQEQEESWGPEKSELLDSSVLSFHGFGGWSFRWSDENRHRNSKDSGDWDNTELAWLINARLTQALSVYSQIYFTSGPSPEGIQVGVDSMFGQWKLSDKLMFRIGRVKLPFGIYGELVRVGTIRPFFDLPQGIYGPVGYTTEAFYGIGVSGRLPLLDDWALNYDLYGGQIEAEYACCQLQEDLEEEGEVGVDNGAEGIKNSIGTRVFFETPIRGFRVGGSGFTGVTDEVGEQERRWVVGSFLEYVDDPVLFRAEYAYLRQKPEVTSHAFFVEGGYYFSTHIQGVVRYDFYNAEKAGLSDNEAEHRAWGAGINIWLNPNFVIKTEYKLIDGHRLVQTNESTSLKDKTHFVQAGLQFSF